MKECKIFVLNSQEPVDKGRQAVAGSFFLHEDGKITMEVNHRYVLIMDDILHRPVFVGFGNKQVTKEENPQAWFQNLPREYHGVYEWAEIVNS